MGTSAIQVFRQLPTPSLRPFVKHFLVVEFPVFHCDTHLPDTSSVAAFSFHGSCNLGGEGAAPPVAFTGIWDTLRAHEHHAGHSVLLATFTPEGAATLVRPPMEEFAGTTVDLAQTIDRPGELHQLREQISDAPDHRSRIGLAERFLLTRFHDCESDALISAAVHWLEQKAGIGRLDDLIRYTGLSQSALERRFQRVVGVAPKRFASLVRLRRAVQLRQNGADFTTVAQAAGYFDQSHFIKDFRRATGSTPEAFFRSAPSG